MYIKMFFGFKRSDSVSQILLETGLPILLRNSRIIFRRTWCKCPNILVSRNLSATAVFLIVLLGLYCAAS